MSLLAPLLVALGPAALQFLANDGCPDTSAVAARLRAIDPAALDSRARRMALLEAQPSGLRARLFDDDGRLLEERRLDGPKTCAEWARISAALLATWEADLSVPELSLPVQTPATPQSTPAAVAQQLRRPPRPPLLDSEVGLGPTGAVAGDGSTAFGGELLIGLSPHGRPYGGQIALSDETFRSVTVADGSARWQRLALSIGGHETFGTGALKLELGAAVLASLLTASGSGFLVTRSASAFDPGFGLSTRLRWDIDRQWMLWLQASPCLWLKTEQVQVLAGSCRDERSHSFAGLAGHARRQREFRALPTLLACWRLEKSVRFDGAPGLLPHATNSMQPCRCDRRDGRPACRLRR